METKEQMGVEELIALYADLLAKYGPHSGEAQRFLAEHRSVPEFYELAQTAGRLHELYGTGSEGNLAGLSLPIRSSRSFFERLVDVRIVAVLFIAVMGAGANLLMVQQLETSRQLSAELKAIENRMPVVASSKLDELYRKLEERIDANLKEEAKSLRTAIVSDVKKIISETVFVSVAETGSGEIPARLKGKWGSAKELSIKGLPQGSRFVVPMDAFLPTSASPAESKTVEPGAPKK